MSPEGSPSSSLFDVRGTSLRDPQLSAEGREEQAERMRTRVRILVQLTTRHGRYRRGLVQAATSLMPDEASLLAISRLTASTSINFVMCCRCVPRT